MMSLVETKLDGQNFVIRPSYGDMGCGVFKRGVTRLERFLTKNQHNERKFLNLENWTNGEPQIFLKL